MDRRYAPVWIRIPGAARGMFPKPRPPAAYVRANAAVQLGAMGTLARSALPALVVALDDSDFNVAETAGWAIKQVKPDTFGSDAFIATMQQHHASITGVIRRIGEFNLRGGSVCRALIEALNSDDCELQLKAIRLLKLQGRYALSAVPKLAKLVCHPDSAIRFAAIELLEDLGRDAQDAVPALRTALDDNSAMVRASVRRALTKIAPE
jgi:HEAT repeat protein